MTEDLLGRVLAADPPPFALLYRPSAAPGVDVIVGQTFAVRALADIPLPEQNSGPAGARSEVLALLPYRQIHERGFECVDDGTPLVGLTVHEQDVVTVQEAADRIPDVPIALTDCGFDVSDADYATMVRQIIAEDIGRGEGSNFVLKRSFHANIVSYSPRTALALFRRLLARESGTYWTFVVHTGERTLVGATPERHLTVDHETVAMNPISGTYRYPPSGPTLPGLIDFLADRKEADELHMVVDEELKVMTRMCDMGIRLSGPFLKEMASLAHTEYFIEGRSTWDVRDLLRETMFAPTVIGSPLESACRVVRRREPEGRGYYSGAVALVGRDDQGRRSLDSAILIRMADIDRDGGLRITVGATVVRHSDPESEAAETRTKAAGLLAALGAGPPARFGTHPEIGRALDLRNGSLARFWREPHQARPCRDPLLDGRTVLVVDNEDAFTSMIDHQLRSLGLTVTVSAFDAPYRFEDHDLVVMGPGPGDPQNRHDRRIVRLRATIRRLLDERRPFLAVCLSHQVLCDLLGLPLVRRAEPNQGVQKEIDLFGRGVQVGFYNTFEAQCGADSIECPGIAGAVEVSRDPRTGGVRALRGPSFCSVQFHAESVLTKDGVGILAGLLTGLLAGESRAPSTVGIAS